MPMRTNTVRGASIRVANERWLQVLNIYGTNFFPCWCLIRHHAPNQGFLYHILRAIVDGWEGCRFRCYCGARITDNLQMHSLDTHNVEDSRGAFSKGMFLVSSFVL